VAVIDIFCCGGAHNAAAQQQIVIRPPIIHPTFPPQADRPFPSLASLVTHLLLTPTRLLS